MNPSLYPSPARRANRRKLLVFVGTFLLLAAAGLFYSYSRPAIYLASARLQINPGAVQVEAALAGGGTQGTNTPRSLLNELQVLTSRPLVKEALGKLPGGSPDALAPASQDPVATAQAGLEATVAEGTDVVEVSSRGADAHRAATLVNALVAAYTRQLSESHAQTNGTALAQARDEVSRLTQKVLVQRRQVEDFRLRHSIVSFEREENEVLGRVKGQTEAMNKANEKLAIAEGRLRALTESAAAGRPIASTSRPNATLENMEQRASEAREELSELNRGFTPEYLAMDPRARALRTRLAELERQITSQRQSSSQLAQTDQSASLADAREEVTAAHATVARTAQQASGNRVALQQFASRFDEFRTLRDALAPQESLLQGAIQRLVRQETGEAARRPSVRVLEPAVAPGAPWQPQYTRDAAIVLGSALLLALLAMGLVELFNRVDAPVPMVVMQAPGYPSPYPPPYPLPYPSAYGALSSYPPHPRHPDDRLGFDPRHAPDPVRAHAASHGASDALPLVQALEQDPDASPNPGLNPVPEPAPEPASAVASNASPDPSAGSPASPSPQVVQPLPMLRELQQDELAGVLSNASPTVALFAHLLLRGLSPGEAITLSGSDVNTGMRTLRIEGAQPAALARELPLDDSLQGLILGAFKLTPSGTAQPLLSAGNGGAVSLDNLTGELLYAAHDASLDRPGEVTPQALSHTYAAFLARQGLRLADLARVIGPLSADQVARYSALAPAGKRLPLEQVQRLMPVLLAEPLTT